MPDQRVHLDMYSGTCGDGKGDRYLWWKSLEAIMTSDGVVRAAQLSRGDLGVFSVGRFAEGSHLRFTHTTTQQLSQTRHLHGKHAHDHESTAQCLARVVAFTVGLTNA